MTIWQELEMLSTGDEVLHGQIVDTNAAWLADFLHKGLPLSPQCVGVTLMTSSPFFANVVEHADVLIVNGGLGPTTGDDLSALAAATAKGEGMVLHEAAQRDGTLFPRTWTSNGTEQP
ncbi:molybdopterin-binding protein [Escherichia coli]